MTDLTNWFVIGCAVVLAVFLLAFCSQNEPFGPFFPPMGQSTKQAESFIPRYWG